LLSVAFLAPIYTKLEDSKPQLQVIRSGSICLMPLESNQTRIQKSWSHLSLKTTVSLLHTRSRYKASKGRVANRALICSWVEFYSGKNSLSSDVMFGYGF
jgi:hypothetical protein